MRRRDIFAGAAAGLWAGALILLSCSCGRPSEETCIRAFLERAARWAEDRDIASLMGLFDPGYRDFEGRDKAATERLISSYLEGRRGIVIHVLGVRVDPSPRPSEREVECEMAFSHGAAEMLRRVIRWSGDYYRFRLALLSDGAGGWRFSRAEWWSIGLPDLFPESMDILEKLFPDLSPREAPNGDISGEAGTASYIIERTKDGGRGK